MHKIGDGIVLPVIEGCYGGECSVLYDATSPDREYNWLDERQMKLAAIATNNFDESIELLHMVRRMFSVIDETNSPTDIKIAAFLGRIESELSEYE